MKRHNRTIALILCMTVIYACTGQTQPKPISNDVALYQTTSLDLKDLEIKENSNCVFEDLKGNKWFGSNGNGLTKYDGKKYSYYNTEQGLAGNFIRDIEQDEKGNLWICTNRGLNFYNGMFFINFSEKIPLRSKETFTAYKDKRGKIYVGAYAGYYIVDGNDFEYLQLPVLDSTISKHVYSVRSVFEDDLGNLWFGTEGAGVFKYDGKEYVQYLNKWLNKGANSSIVQDKNGLIWIGNNTSGLIKYDGKEFNNLIIKDTVKFNNQTTVETMGVTSMLVDDFGNIWVGSRNLGLWKVNEKANKRIETKSSFVNSLYIDSKGKIWVSLLNDGC